MSQATRITRAVNYFLKETKRKVKKFFNSRTVSNSYTKQKINKYKESSAGTKKLGSRKTKFYKGFKRLFLTCIGRNDDDKLNKVASARDSQGSGHGSSGQGSGHGSGHNSMDSHYIGNQAGANSIEVEPAASARKLSTIEADQVAKRNGEKIVSREARVTERGANAEQPYEDPNKFTVLVDVHKEPAPLMKAERRDVVHVKEESHEIPKKKKKLKIFNKNSKNPESKHVKLKKPESLSVEKEINEIPKKKKKKKLKIFNKNSKNPESKHVKLKKPESLLVEKESHEIPKKKKKSSFSPKLKIPLKKNKNKSPESQYIESKMRENLALKTKLSWEDLDPKVKSLFAKNGERVKNQHKIKKKPNMVKKTDLYTIEEEYNSPPPKKSKIFEDIVDTPDLEWDNNGLDKRVDWNDLRSIVGSDSISFFDDRLNEFPEEVVEDVFDPDSSYQGEVNEMMINGSVPTNENHETYYQLAPMDREVYNAQGARPKIKSKDKRVQRPKKKIKKNKNQV